MTSPVTSSELPWRGIMTSHFRLRLAITSLQTAFCTPIRTRLILLTENVTLILAEHPAVLPGTSARWAKTVTTCFHYGCALRCVAREIETLSASLRVFLSPRNATRRNAQPWWKYGLSLLIFAIISSTVSQFSHFLAYVHFVHCRKFATGGCIVSPPNAVCVTALPCKILPHDFTRMFVVYLVHVYYH